jgi:hypothetical protein
MADNNDREMQQQQRQMEQRQPEGELAEQEVSELPERDNMSLVNANLAAPINAALALNVASDNSVAVANAQQYAPIQESEL